MHSLEVKHPLYDQEYQELKKLEHKDTRRGFAPELITNNVKDFWFGVEFTLFSQFSPYYGIKKQFSTQRPH